MALDSPLSPQSIKRIPSTRDLLIGENTRPTPASADRSIPKLRRYLVPVPQPGPVRCPYVRLYQQRF
jgi:hypothetical protein